MKTKKGKHETLDRQLKALFGDPASVDGSELDNFREETGDGSDLVQIAYDLAARAAQQSRLEGKPVPPHVQAALTQIKEANSLEGATSTELAEIVDWVLKPFRGPTKKLAFNHRRLTHKSKKDERLLEQLGEEVKQDWTKEDESERD